MLGLLLGGISGFLLAWSKPTAPAKSTAFLREFSFRELAAQAGQTNWTVREDRLYEPFPSMARSQRVGRRVIAQAEISKEDFGGFTTKFDNAVRALLGEYGAMAKGHFDTLYDVTRRIDDKTVRSRIDLPRRYYAIGDVHGVADFGYVAEDGRVTVIISLMEGS